eukprot:TRINITY_DN65823_c0_g1_i1.p1 TRINITY_DN65823_c0_g1~~TRINITY_DN65823_c0_g1_i1.p1  ORF type:complete len:475 (+),score=72.18 TRINITY_DN65823_c0_g1_i1:93-1517(+)
MPLAASQCRAASAVHAAPRRRSAGCIPHPRRQSATPAPQTGCGGRARCTPSSAAQGAAPHPRALRTSACHHQPRNSPMPLRPRITTASPAARASASCSAPTPRQPTAELGRQLHRRSSAPPAASQLAAAALRKLAASTGTEEAALASSAAAVARRGRSSRGPVHCRVPDAAPQRAQRRVSPPPAGRSAPPPRDSQGPSEGTVGDDSSTATVGHSGSDSGTSRAAPAPQGGQRARVPARSTTAEQRTPHAHSAPPPRRSVTAIQAEPARPAAHRGRLTTPLEAQPAAAQQPQRARSNSPRVRASSRSPRQLVPSEVRTFAQWERMRRRDEELLAGCYSAVAQICGRATDVVRQTSSWEQSAAESGLFCASGEEPQRRPRPEGRRDASSTQNSTPRRRPCVRRRASNAAEAMCARSLRITEKRLMQQKILDDLKLGSPPGHHPLTLPDSPRPGSVTEAYLAALEMWTSRHVPAEAA